MADNPGPGDTFGRSAAAVPVRATVMLSSR
jgi:hypothetical protein